MAIPQNKAELRSAILTNYQKLKADLATIPAQKSTLKTMDGHVKHSLMSPQNLLAYLIGWGESVLDWEESARQGEEAELPAKGYKWNQLGLLAQKFYRDYAYLDYQGLNDKLDLTVNNLLELVDQTPESELYGKPWHGKWTKGRLIQLNSSSPYKNARARLRKWKRENKL